MKMKNVIVLFGIILLLSACGVKEVPFDPRTAATETGVDIAALPELPNGDVTSSDEMVVYDASADPESRITGLSFSGLASDYIDGQGSWNDFDMDVTANSAVTANTAKITNATHTGDVAGATDLTIGAAKILEEHLKSVNSPTDEYCLTYELTTGDFEWQTCGIGTGDVSVSGVPVINQLAIWTDSSTIKGDPNVTYDGANFTVSGTIVSSASDGNNALVFSNNSTTPYSPAASENSLYYNSNVLKISQNGVESTLPSATQVVYAITVEDPGASEDLSMGFTNAAATITECRAVLIGSATPTVKWYIKHATDRSAAGAALVTAGTTTTSVTTGDDVTSFDDATIVADSFVWLETDTQSGTVTELHISCIGSVD